MLNIYIEQEFLDKFHLKFEEDNSSKIQSIVYKMLVDYPETNIFLNYDISTIEEFNKFKLENPIIASKTANNIAPKSVISIKKAVLEQSGNEISIVFTDKTEDWFQEAEKNGVLCFSYNNYEIKINEIINTFHYKIDLSIDGFNWKSLRFVPIFNQIKVNDNYILTDKRSMEIDKNISILLKNAFDNYKRKAKLEIYTKDFNPQQPRGNQQIIDAAEQKMQKLKNIFKNYTSISFKIINNSVWNTSPLNFHDRVVFTNFQIIDCGIGFNLIPHKASNSQIVSETIFEIYSYRRLKNLTSAHNKYLNKITNDNFQTLEFKYL